jgi:superfamily II DNA or RNA helicase
MQQVGRILRPQPGKLAIVLDHVKNTIVHGFVDTPREWDLKSKAKRKKPGEVAPRVTVCEVCYATYRPQPVCPVCGHIKETKRKEIDQVDGDLVELKRDKPWLAGRERRDVEKAQARTLEALQALGRKRGYKEGWAFMVYDMRKRKRR